MSGFELPPPSRDPLYALLTAGGPGALAVFALDGEGAGIAWRKVFQPRHPTRLSLPPPGQPLFGRVQELGLVNGGLADEAITAYVPPEESPTACEHFELSVHGGFGALESVSRALEAAGFRPAKKGELDCRAHRAARLPLPDLEARLRLGGKPARNGRPAPFITERQAAFLLSNAGQWRARWERLGYEMALGMRTQNSAWRETLFEAASVDLQAAPAVQNLLRSARVVLAGPPNAGKSTLSNRLLRAQKSLTSPEAGTTRDVLEQPCEIRGLSIFLSDSAGLQASGNGSATAELERAAQARALDAVRDADLLLLLLDGSRAPSEADSAALAQALEIFRVSEAERPAWLILNKSDLGTDPEAAGLGFALGLATVSISAREGQGHERLEFGLERALLWGRAEEQEQGAEDVAPDAPKVLPAPFTRRQCRLLNDLKTCLTDGQEDVDVLAVVRALVGSRPHEVELEKIFKEWLP